MDPVESAEDAGLRYVTDAAPGIRRGRAGRGFTYVAPDGKRLTDPGRLAWIRGLAIPPAWTDVWICTSRHGHLQATGRDARGRKQYHYHPRWRATRDESKYGRMIAFGQALPRIRRRIASDLRRSGLPRERVPAAVVRLLEETGVRVGNDEYARDNKSFGLTTLRQRHAEVGSTRIRLRFRGKGGKESEVDVSDPRLARIVRRCQDFPGQDLFAFVDDDGQVVSIGSADVNDYLRDISGHDLTAKDFRTWAGTVIAAEALRDLEPAGSDAIAKGNVVRAIEEVASWLGNTPAVSRKAYVHPGIVDAYLEGGLVLDAAVSARRAPRRSRLGLSRHEREVLALLRRREHAARGR